MSKNKLIILRISLLFVLGIVVKLLVDDTNYYKDAHELNRNLEADALQLMMPIEEVRNLYGKEEVFNVGFGGDFYEYPSRGVTFSVSTDSEYDLFNKVGDLRITNMGYSVFGIFTGIEETKASEILISKGYKENVGYYGEKLYIKGCVYIDFSLSKGKVLGLRIVIKDKNDDPNRIY